jgi:myo-inositol-1(or 4)-monophosphatase
MMEEIRQVQTAREMIAELGEHVRQAVTPHLGTWRARRITGTAASGDATFDIDDIAEEAVEEFLRAHGLNVAYYSEDRGLVQPFGSGTPEGILIIDPIDGTRAAVAGLESCVVSVAWTDYKPKPTLGDVHYGSIVEIKSGQAFTAARGEGVQIRDASGREIQAEPLQTKELSRMACALEVVGAPLDLILAAVSDILSGLTLRGGFFVLNSSAFTLTRLMNGQLSGHIDVRNRLLKDFPQTRNLYAHYGGGHPVSLYGYDIAAGALIAQEAGCVITDGWGRSLDDWDLLDTSEANFGSLLAASNAELHAALVQAVDAGFARLKEQQENFPALCEK